MNENDLGLVSCDSATPTMRVESVSPLTSPDEMTPEAIRSQSIKTDSVPSGTCDTQVQEETQLTSNASVPLIVDESTATPQGSEVKLRMSHVTFWNEGKKVDVQVEVSPAESPNDFGGDNVLDGLNVNQSADVGAPPQPSDLMPTDENLSDATIRIVRSRGDADNDFDNRWDGSSVDRGAEANAECFKDQDNIVFSLEEEEEEEEKIELTDRVESSKNDRSLRRLVSDTPLPISQPHHTKDDEPKPSSVWYNPENKKEPVVKLYEDEEEEEDIFDVVNNLPRTEILTNLQSIISFSKLTINKTENVLRRWKKINMNPFRVPSTYDSREEYIEDLCLPLDIQISLHLKEASKLVMQFDLIPDLMEGVEDIQNEIISDIKKKYVRQRRAPIHSQELAEEYNYFRSTDVGRTATGRRRRMKKLVDIMDVISEA